MGDPHYFFKTRRGGGAAWVAVLVFFLTLWGGCPALGQTDPTNYIRTDLIGPSPNVASLGQQAEVPLTHYTGLPRVSIPIYTLQGRELSLPVTLSYHFLGFKPVQVSGWAGLGWSLDAGGVITRNVRDKVDELGTAAGTFDTIQNILNLAGTDWNFLDNAVTQALVDTEPDIYSFSFAGYSGKFLRYRGQVHLLPDTKLRVQGDPSSGFLITTEDGTRYFFNEIEQTTARGSPEASYNLPTHNSAWHLSRIENASGTEQIDLYYTAEGQIVQHGTVTQTYKYVHPGQSDNTGPNQQFSNLFNKKTTYPTFVAPKRLQSIVMGGTTVTFTPAPSARLDIDQGVSGDARALQGITVAHDISGLVSEFELFHRYTTSSGFNGRILFLDSVRQVSTLSGPSPQVHAFQYASIPAFGTKTGAAVDHFGYYLGSGDFGSNILPSGIVPGGIINRDPQLAGTVAGALIRVDYPTGGYTTLDYELNRRFDGYNYEQIPTYVNALVSGSPLPSEVIPSTDKYFRVDTDQTVNIHLVRTAPNPFWDNHARNLSSDFRIMHDDGGLLLPVYYGQIDLESDNAGKDFPVFLQAGDYYLTSFIDERETAMSATVATFTDGDPLPGALSGGLRLAQSVSYPLEGSPLTRTYTYKDEDGFSSGVMPFPMGYVQRDYTDYVAEAPTNYIRTIHSTIYNSAIGEFYGIGIPHFYTNVLEEQVSGSERLRTRHEYTNFQAIGNFMGIEPLRTTSYRQEGSVWVPVSKREFDYHVATDTIIHAISPYLRSRVIEAGGLYPPPQNTYAYDHLMIWKQWLATVSERNVTYGPSDSLVVTTNYHYDAGAFRNLQVVRRTDSRGGQTVTRFKYPEEYSTGLAGPSLAAHVLSPAWEEQVWRKTAPTDSVLVSGRITQFSTQFLPEAIYTLGNLQPLAAPDNQSVSGGKFTTLLSDSRYAQRAALTYDVGGRLITQQVPGGPPQAYLWDHDGRYVLAETTGAGPSDIAFAGFEDQAKGNWTYSGTTVADATAPTGKRAYNLSGGNLSKSGLTSSRVYVLSYWAKSGAAGSISGGTATAIRTAGAWTLYRRTLTGLSSLTISGSVVVDDVRLHPLEAAMTTYTYDPLVGMTSQTDASGQIRYYEYDGFRRLRAIRDQDGNLVEQHLYHLAPH